MPLFPPGAPVSIIVDGRPVAAYVRAYVVAGRVYAPVSPLLTRLADRVWFVGNSLLIERGSVRVRVRIAPVVPASLNATYVAIAPVLRAIGASVRYESAGRRLIVQVPQRAILASPTPFNPSVPSVAPSAVFTPAPAQTPRPVWTGSPLPRRTPLSVPPIVSVAPCRQDRGEAKREIEAQTRREG